MVGQTSTSIISGTVTDSSGAVVAGAKVDVKNVGTGIVISLSSDAQGRFRAPDVIIGDYEVQASQAGFQTVVRKGITTTVGGEAIVDIALPVGQAQQVVTVDAQVSQVDTTTSAIGNTVTKTQIEELPMGSRNQTDLLSLSPGVAYSRPTGGANYGRQDNYSVSGSRANGIQFLIDNTNLQTFNGHSTGSSATGATLGIEAIGDYQTLTNTYSAQFGGNGGVVNAASKSGTNSFHGSTYFYLQNTALLTARSPFDTFIRPGDTAAQPPPSHKGLLGASLGGPIKKNKAFFYANYEGVRQGLESEGVIKGVPDINAHAGYLPCSVAKTFTCNTSTNLAFVGIPASIAPLLALFPVGLTSPTTGIGNFVSVSPQSNHDDYLLTRFDYTISSKDNLFVRYVRDTAQALTQAPNGGSVPGVSSEADTTANHFVTIEEDHVISPTLINLARLSFLRPHENAETTTPALPAMAAINTPGTSQGTLFLGSNLSLGPTALVPYGMSEQTYQGMDDVVWTRGAHSIKFGAMFAEIADFTHQGNTGAQWTFQTILGFLTATPTQLTGALPGYVNTNRDAISRQFMPYINDEWKVTRKLTLNLGVRYEWLSNPNLRHDQAYNVTNALTNTTFMHVSTVMPNNPTTHNFAPRIGFAYDPFPNHKTSIRGGFGMFYNELTAHIWIDPYWTNTPLQNVAVANPTWPVPFSGGATNAVPVTAQWGLSWLDKLHTPYMMQYNLSIQREVMPGTVFSIAYVGSKGIHLLGSRDYNFPISINGATGTAIAGGLVASNPRPNPNFGYMFLRSTYSRSNYNSLQTSLSRRFANHFQAQIAYTYSRSMDLGSGDSSVDSGGASGGNEYAVNPHNTNLEYARSNFDHAQVLKINGIYELPFTRNEFVKGWRLSGILTSQSGQPYTIFDGFDNNGSGLTGKDVNARPNLNPACVAGGSMSTFIGTLSQWYNPACYSLSPIGTTGNLGRNTAIGPSINAVNFALLKRTAIHKISEQFNLEFRAELTNAFNHPIYALPNQALYNSATTANATAGQITATVQGGRAATFAIKATF